jgi:NhaP-type Na+/H+ or K+/H+ antiporter
VSLFVAGLTLRTPFLDGRWKLPLRLATVSMTLTVAGIAALGFWGLGLPIGAAVLLGAVLAPTDPVLASDVQVEDPTDTDRLRFSLTGEAGFNDGAAFPFVMLGLGLLGLHDLGAWGWKWAAVDVLWAVFGSLAIGGALGVAVGRLVVYLRRTHKQAIGTDDFLALGLVALVYGVALLASTYAFLAAFAAGLALRYEERRETVDKTAGEEEAMVQPGDTDEAAVDDRAGPAYMASAVLGFSEQLEKMAALALVVLVGMLLHLAEWSFQTLWFVLAVFLIVRPLAVWVGLLASDTSRLQRGLAAWFGVRGIGSVYYLMFAVTHGLYDGFAERLLGLVLATIATSIVVHGLSVTPVMVWYSRRVGRKEGVRDG